MRLIKKQELLDVMQANVMPFDGALIADEIYCMTTRTWINGIFASAFTTFKSGLEMNGWLPEAWDCDNFAQLCAAFASVLNARTEGHPAAGLAFGEFWYKKDSGNRHAVNFFVTTGFDGSLELAFFEPQLSTPVLLTKTEIESCDGYRV